MNNDLRILISGLLDTEQTTKDINKQISRLTHRLDRLKINVQIDENILNTMKQFSTQMKRIQGDALQLGKRMEEVVLPDGTKVKTTRFDDLHQSMDNLIIKAKEAKKVSETFVNASNDKTKAVEQEAKATNKLVNELENLGKVSQRVTKQDGIGNLTGTTEKYNKGYVDTIVNTDKNGRVTSMRIVENLKQEDEATRKLIQSKNELRQKHNELIQLGQLSSKQSLNMQRMIETSSNPEQIKKATDEHKRLLAISQQQLTVEKARYSENKKKQEQIRLEREHNKELAQQVNIYKQRKLNEASRFQQRYGDLMDGKTTKQFESYMASLNRLDASMPQVERKMKNLSAGFDNIRTTAITSAKAIDTSNRSVISFGNAMKTALIKFPINLHVGIKLL